MTLMRRSAGAVPGGRRGVAWAWATRLLLVAGIVVLTMASLAGAASVPALQGRVNDYAGLLSDATKRRLETRLAEFERTDSTQIVVLTVESLGGESLEEYSVRVAQAWGIGQKGKDNGAVLLVAKKERAVRIEVGYGLEWRLTDILAGRIVDEVVAPRFRQGRFDEGVTEGVDAMVAAVRGEYKADGRDGRGAGRGEGGGLVAAVVAMFFFASLFRGLPGPVRGVIGAVGLPLLGALFSAGLLLTILFVPLGFLLGVFLPYFFGGGGRGGGRRGGGMFHGGGFGGGFGGFGGSGGGFSGGGGGFGGGGASGRW